MLWRSLRPLSLRQRLALTVFLTGLATALAVLATVALSFQRFERETSYRRAEAFMSRVLEQHDTLLEQHHRSPEEFANFLRSLLLFDPDSRLYLLDAQGRLLSSSSNQAPPPGFLVPLPGVMRAVDQAAKQSGKQVAAQAYLMGYDPDFADDMAIIVARALRRSSIGPGPATQGYLYLACRKQNLPAQHWALFGSSLAGPALATVAGLIVLAALLTAWIIVAVTKPLQRLSEEMVAAERLGFALDGAAHQEGTSEQAARTNPNDEVVMLRNSFHALLAKLRQQWDQLHRLDHFRRESVSNLSHDLRSPLTATVACLETLERRWNADPASTPGQPQDQQLLEVALRNTRNAAGLVRSLGDLALLDEPQFKLRLSLLNLGDVLDDICRRFEPRAQRLGVQLQFVQRGTLAPAALVDAELFERAVANLLDNALKYSLANSVVELSVQHVTGSNAPKASANRIHVHVQDQGPGIAAQDLPRLFDRLYRSRTTVAPASSDEGKGLGLAIVKRIAELHQGQVLVDSVVGHGTRVTLDLPAA